MTATISLPTTSCEDLRRKWARDVALEVRDAIREHGLPHALWMSGQYVHYDLVGREMGGWTLAGVYDVEASIGDIADDIMAVDCV